MPAPAKLVPLSIVLVALGGAVESRADGTREDAAVRADRVEIDLRTQAIDARGDVRIDAPPYHLRSEHLAIRRAALGLVVEGEGRLFFCPCLGAPLAVAFAGARLLSADDVVVRSPRLELFGVPVLWAPAFWLRSPAHVGLLAPDLAYRGADGFFVGEGVHLPWREGDASSGGLDLRGGAYLDGGAAVDARIYTPATALRVRWDHLRGDGAAIDARGTADSVAWDADVLRGARGVAATTDLDAAARVYDRAAAETWWRFGGLTVASRIDATARRGEDARDLGAIGPTVVARGAEAIGRAGAYDVAIAGGVLRRPETAGAFAFARSEAGAHFAARAGAFEGDLSLRGVGDVASDGQRRGFDGVGSARLALSLPLARGFASADPLDPWIHRVDPRVELGVVGAARDDAAWGPLGRSDALGDFADGAAWVATVGVRTALARWGSRAGAALDVAGGAVGSGRAEPLLRARASILLAWLRLSGESAHVFSSTAGYGHALIGRARIGPVDGPSLGVHATGRAGVDPVAARAVTEAPLEPRSGFLDREGWTGGARLSLPWTRHVVTRASLDTDLTRGTLVAAGGGLELRDGCGCLVVRANAAHRLGRDGVDVWLTVDVVRTR